MTVSDILKNKETHIYSVTGNVTVYDALILMREKNIGALMVIENGSLVGIISERDYARKVILQGKSSQETSVNEIMTSKVITVSSNDDLEQCMELMSKKDIRHLPVVNQSEVLGMISIGDVLKSLIRSQKETIEHLKNYIAQ